MKSDIVQQTQQLAGRGYGSLGAGNSYLESNDENCWKRSILKNCGQTDTQTRRPTIRVCSSRTNQYRNIKNSDCRQNYWLWLCTLHRCSRHLLLPNNVEYR